jgi:hypothetical protein
MLNLNRLTWLLSALIAFAAMEAVAQTNRSGSVPLSVRTASGQIHNTTVMWKGDHNELVVTNVADHVSSDQVADLFDTLRMQLARATAVDLRSASRKRSCCATMSGSGVGFAGNVRANITLEQRVEGADRVVQTVVIRGYSGPPLDAYTAKLLFQ